MAESSASPCSTASTGTQRAASSTLIGVGEAGKEAALPLNAKTYREIARGIVSEGGGGGVTVSGNTFYVREEADINRIAEELVRKARREGWSMA